MSKGPRTYTPPRLRLMPQGEPQRIKTPILDRLLEPVEMPLALAFGLVLVPLLNCLLEGLFRG